MKTIFIPVDFTEQSLLSCKFAFHAFKGETLSITLFHSYFDQLALAESHLTTDLEPNMIGLMDQRLFNDLKEAAEDNLVALVEEAKSLAKAMDIPNLELIAKSEGGLPLNEVLHNIKEHHYDIIILGSKKDPNQRLGEGSLQAKIMNRCHVPVVVVPPEYTGKEIKNIIYLSEFNMVDIDNIRLLGNLFPSSNHKIEILHFVEGKTDFALQKMEGLKQAFKDTPFNKKLNFKIQDAKKILNHLQDAVIEGEISFIAFMPHKRSFSQLFSHQILNKRKLLHLEIPIISIPLIKDS